MRTTLLAGVSISISLLQGCATITGSEMQPISLTTQTVDGQVLDGVRCSLRNDKGAWSGMSPGFVNVSRSAEDLVIECRRQGFPDGLGRAISRAHGGMFGNIILGGGIGAIIDHSKGTGYEYPNTIPVRMGRSIVVDRADQGQVKEEPVAASSEIRPNTPRPPEQHASTPPAPPPQQQATNQPTRSPALHDSGTTAQSAMSDIAISRYGIERPHLDQPLPTRPRPVAAMSHEVEKLARSQGCNSSKGAELLTEPGVFETFRVRCDSGGELTVRCEYRNCRILN